MRVEIAPSILTADLTRLGEQLDQVLNAGAKRIHVDVMDGRFVPNLTFGPLVVKGIKPIVEEAGALLETHLMIEEPETLIPEFSAAGADLITVHVETCPHLNRTIQQIKALGVKAGVTLNPSTPLGSLEEVLGEVDLVLVMSVNPGFGGQTYLPASSRKISRLRQMLQDRDLAVAAFEQSVRHVESELSVHGSPLSSRPGTPAVPPGGLAWLGDVTHRTASGCRRCGVCAGDPVCHGRSRPAVLGFALPVRSAHCLLR